MEPSPVSNTKHLQQQSEFFLYFLYLNHLFNLPNTRQIWGSLSLYPKICSSDLKIDWAQHWTYEHEEILNLFWQIRHFNTQFWPIKMNWFNLINQN